MEPIKGVGVQKLLDSRATYSGWLKQQKNNRRFKRTYCVIHCGYFHCFQDDVSATAKAVFPLAGYFASPRATSDASAPFVFDLIGRTHNYQPRYTFSASSKRELDEWIDHINEEVANQFPALLSASGDVKDSSFPYDEPKLKPDEVFFWDQEKAGVEPAPVLSSDSWARFTGPRMNVVKQEYDTPKVFMDNLLQTKITEGPPEPPPRTIVPLLPLATERSAVPDYEVPNSIETSVTSPVDLAYERMDGSPGYIPVAARSRPLVPSPILSKHGSERRQADNASPIPGSNIEELPESALLPASVYQWNLDRDQSVAVLTSKKIEGMYLIRRGNNEKKVITAYVVGGVKHYIIFQSLNDNHEKEFFLKKGEPRFQKLADLVRYYYRNNLPTCSAVLRVPYQ